MDVKDLQYNIKKQLKMLNSVNIFVEMINKLRRNYKTEV